MGKPALSLGKRCQGWKAVAPAPGRFLRFGGGGSEDFQKGELEVVGFRMVEEDGVVPSLPPLFHHPKGPVGVRRGLGQHLVKRGSVRWWLQLAVARRPPP